MHGGFYMLDIKVIRENLDWSKKKLATRGIKPEELDELVEIDTKRRKDLTKSEQLKAKRNDVSKQIAEKKRNKEDASDAIASMREVGKEIKDLDKEVEELTQKQNYILLRLPNFPADSDPVGPDDSYNEEVRKWEEPTKFDFKPKAHWDIGTDLGILDWDRASRFQVHVLFTTLVQVHFWNVPYLTSSLMKTPRMATPKLSHHTW